MERMPICPRLIYVDDPNDNRLIELPVRSITKKAVLVGSPTDYPDCLTPNQIRRVIEIAGRITTLANPDELYPRYIETLQRSKESTFRRRSGKARATNRAKFRIDVWRKTAQSVLEDYFKAHHLGTKSRVFKGVSTGLDQIPQQYLLSWRVGRRTVMEEAQFKRDLHEGSPYNKRLPTRPIMAVCPAIGIGRIWYETALQVIRRYEQEKSMR